MDASARKMIMETYKARTHKAFMRGDAVAQVRSATDWRSLATEGEARRAPHWLCWKARPKEEKRWGRQPGMTVALELLGRDAVRFPVADYAEASSVARAFILRNVATAASLGARHGEVLVGTHLVARVAFSGRVSTPHPDAWRQEALYELADDRAA